MKNYWSCFVQITISYFWSWSQSFWGTSYLYIFFDNNTYYLSTISRTIFIISLKTQIFLFQTKFKTLNMFILLDAQKPTILPIWVGKNSNLGKMPILIFVKYKKRQSEERKQKNFPLKKWKKTWRGLTVLTTFLSIFWHPDR